MYTSRSAIEAFHDCPRYRYLTYHWNGTGIVPLQKSVPLATGTGIHRGIEHLLNRVRIEQEPDVETAVGLAVEEYVKDVEKVGFRGNDLQSNRQQWFTFCEQKALIEALIRVWHLVELPEIVRRFKVLAVEREIDPIEITPGVWLQAKVDAEFQDKASGDYLNYSIKSMKQWDERAEASYMQDLQGITEGWAVEEDSRRLVRKWKELVDAAKELGFAHGPRNLVEIAKYLGARQPTEKRVMGVRFCILVKGKQYNPEYNAESVLTTYSPLIRGYKNFTPTSQNFAHSFTYPDPNNQSGKGRLGKGWEPFNVWESEFGVRGWIQALASGQIQPNCGDILRQQVFSPPEFFRDAEEMAEGIMEIAYQEARIATALEDIKTHERFVLAQTFPHIRKHCEYHFGGQCEMKAVCYKPEVRADILGSGLYQIRVPHHEAEKESLRV